VALTKFWTAQPFGPYLHQGNNVDAKESWPELVAQASIFSVELPGIEPVPKNSLTCGNTGFDDSKRRRVTCGYAEGVDGINTPRPRAAVVAYSVKIWSGECVISQCALILGNS
jgi:hypothetical protein